MLQLLHFGFTRPGNTGAVDHPLDSTDPDGTFRHVVPASNIVRAILIVAGLFVVFISIWELWRGVWPFNFASPFFALLIAGALSVGIPVLGAGLFAPATTWIIRPGTIELILISPFRQEVRHLTPGAVASFDFAEHDSDSGPNTWSVVLKTATGERFETRSFGSLAAATALRDKIEAVFRA